MNAGRQYLTDHGISVRWQGKFVDRFQLGVVLKPLPGDERFEGMLAVPYLTPRGCRAIKFRRLDDGKPKYAQVSGQAVRLYNTRAYFDADDVIAVAEGEIDAAVASTMLHMPTLGIPGAEMWVAHSGIWAHLFKNFQRVLILRDGDEAGKELARAITDSLKLKARTIEMPEGEDVSSMVAAGRAEELTKQFAEGDDDDDDEPPDE